MVVWSGIVQPGKRTETKGKIMETEAQFMADQIGEKLIGWKITAAIVTDAADEYDQRFGFQLSKGKKKLNVWVDRDAESNGAGWLAIEAAA